MKLALRPRSWHAASGLGSGGSLLQIAMPLSRVRRCWTNWPPGPQERSANWLTLVAALPVLPVESAIAEIVQAYIRHKVMPGDSAGDALHLALASYHKCDFLVTWNCEHLANANKFGHIRRVNTMLGLFVPALVTPLELLGGSHERDSE